MPAEKSSGNPDDRLGCQEILTRDETGNIMSRMTEDGRHEGYVEHVFSDGYSGTGWSEGGDPNCTHRPDGTRLPWDDQQTRTIDQIVGWRATCDDSRSSRHCWTGPLWTRVLTEKDLDPAGREIFHEAHQWLLEETEDLVMEAWDAHVAPTAGTYEVELAAREVAEAQRRLTAAVVAARGQGASWEAVGRAAGMSRQSAHERWARVS